MDGEGLPERSGGLTASIGFWLGLVLFLILFVIPSPEVDGSLTTEAKMVGAVTLICATWWITQPIPIPATSLLPLVLFPVLGVMKADDVAKAYVADLIMLMMGGFFLSKAIEKCGLHRRIALRIIATMGPRPQLLVLGFMIATAALSMWISNTATCLMILPIALAILGQVAEANPGEEAGSKALGVTLMLGIAYAANVGGIGTPIGTPPNVIYMQMLSAEFPNAPPITFPQWMGTTIPLVILLVPLIWLLLTRVLSPIPSSLTLGDRDVVQDHLRRLGPMSTAEKRVSILFAVTAILWIFRQDIPLGESGARIPGVVTLLARLGLPDAIADKDVVKDGTVAIFMTVIFFLVPSGTAKKDSLLDWKTASRIPWGLLLLFGGGLAIAQGFRETGLSDWMGQRLQSLDEISPLLMVGAVCLLMTFLTEVTSNTAITTVMMPILASLSRGIQVNPILLMMPAAISASFAFMMPVGTGPNAVIFSSGRVSVRQMAKAGILLNLICAAVLTAYVYLVLVKGMGVGFDPPDWAK